MKATAYMYYYYYDYYYYYYYYCYCDDGGPQSDECGDGWHTR